MSQRTQEEYKKAVENAMLAHDNAIQQGEIEEAKKHSEAAEKIAIEAVSLYGPYQPPSDPDNTYAKGVSERFEDFKPVETLKEYLSEFTQRRQTLGERPSALAGAIATAGIGLSQAARTGGELLADGISVLVPDFVREGAETAWNSIKEKPTVQQGLQALTDSLEAYQGWARENPEVAEVIETTVDVAALTSSAAKIDISSSVKKSKDKFDNAVVEERMAGIKKLLGPEYVGEQGFNQNQWVSSGGILNKSEYVFSEKELKIHSAIESVKELNVNSHFVKAAQVVHKAIEKKSTELIAFIKKAGNPKYNKKEFKEELEAEFKNLGNSKEWVNLTDEAQNKTNEYLRKVLGMLEESDGDSLGLLQLRRDFDDLVSFGSGKNPLEPTVQSAKSTAGTFVRNVLNAKLQRITPQNEVKDRLTDLHYLMLGRDRLNVRKHKEGGNRIIRTWNKIKDDLSLPSTPLALMATYGAVGTVGATTGLGAGAATYIAIQGLKRKSRLKFYATVLSGLDKTIKKYQSDKNVVAELRADRAYIVYLLNETRKETEEEENQQTAAAETQ
tara:strand:+ start:5653 stop:7323 length:1671 start_codon:yes stop_codon:yes gene_type:complete